MRAVAVAEFGDTPQLMELPKPKPAPGEVLVRLLGACLNPLDRAIYSGMLGHMPHVLPLVLGIDGAGIVEEVGEGADGFAVGDAVFGVFAHEPLGRGTFAEFIAAPADVLIGEAPSEVPLVEAAAAPTSGMTAIGLVDETEIAAGQKVLVVGASGGVGSFAVQLAAARGAQVIATGRADATERLRVLGAAETVDYGDGSVAERVTEMEPDGVDVLLDLVSPPEAFAANAELVREGGRAASTVFGAQADFLDADHRIDAVNFTLRAHPRAPVFLKTLAEEIDSGQLQVVIDMEVSLEEASAAVASRESGGARGKMAVVI